MAKVKICGVTNLEDALIAEEEGANIIGFVFANSPRRIKTTVARDIIAKLSAKIGVATVFVDEKKEVIEGIIRQLERVDFIQLHGNETPEYCKHFKGIKVIKAFRIKDELSLKQIADFENIDFVLLDTFDKIRYGGTGKTFNWDIAVKAKAYGKPIILSGGLAPENVKEALLKVMPDIVDVSSGVEISPAKKDRVLIRRFIEIAKSV